MTRQTRSTKRERRHAHIRQTVSGTTAKPRLCVFRSGRHIYAQLIDDEAGCSLGTASDLKSALKTPMEKAEKVGTDIAKLAQKLGVTTVVFDRGGYKYHGRVKSLAEAARQAGLQF